VVGSGSARNMVVFAFFFSGLRSREFGIFSLLGEINFYLPSQLGVLLSQCYHLVSTTLLKVSELLLHLGLPF